MGANLFGSGARGERLKELLDVVQNLRRARQTERRYHERANER